MKSHYKLFASLFIISAIGGCSEVAPIDQNPAVIDAPAIIISAEDFAPLIGDDWEGALTYLNYGSDKRSTIPVKMIIAAANGGSISYAIQYPGEEDANIDGVIEISENGSTINGHPVTSRRSLPDGGVEIVTEAQDRDDNRPADIQTIYTITETLFKMRKAIRFEREADWIERNEYILKR